MWTSKLNWQSWKLPLSRGPLGVVIRRSLVLNIQWQVWYRFNFCSLLMEYLLDMISHELIFIFIQSDIWIGAVHPVFLSDPSYKKLNKSLSQCCIHTHITQKKKEIYGNIHLHVISLYLQLHPISQLLFLKQELRICWSQILWHLQRLCDSRIAEIKL